MYEHKWEKHGIVAYLLYAPYPAKNINKIGEKSVMDTSQTQPVCSAPEDRHNPLELLYLCIATFDLSVHARLAQQKARRV